jgi:hypothetical protein
MSANGLDTPVVLDSLAAAAAAAFRHRQHNNSANGTHSPKNIAAAAVAGADGSSSSNGAQLQVLVARKSLDWTAGAAAADTAGGVVDMRPDNVHAWFTKVRPI